MVRRVLEALSPILVTVAVAAGLLACTAPFPNDGQPSEDTHDCGSCSVQAEGGAPVRDAGEASVEPQDALDVPQGRDRPLDGSSGSGPEVADAGTSRVPDGNASSPDTAQANDAPAPNVCQQPSPNAVWEAVTLPTLLVRIDAGTTLARDSSPNTIIAEDAAGLDVAINDLNGEASTSIDAALDQASSVASCRAPVCFSSTPLLVDAAPITPGPGTVVAVQAFGPADVWAMTGDQRIGHSLQHWDGAGWTVLADTPPPGDYRAMWGSSSTDLWLSIGHQDESYDELMHWNGSSWSAVVPDPNQHARFISIWGTGPDDVWLMGPLQLWHWDGMVWKTYDLPQEIPAPKDAPTQTGPFLLDVMWGSSKNDIWAAGFIQYPMLPAPNGSSGSTDVITYAHWDGAAWTVLPPASLAEVRTGEVNAMWGSSKDDIWAGGTTFAPGQPAILDHFDGTEWHPNQTSVPGYIDSIWGSCTSDVWAVGMQPNIDVLHGIPLLLHFDGSTWTPTTFPLAPTAEGALFTSVSGTDANDVWFGWGFGNDRTISTRENGGLFRRHLPGR
jgi:hypothetical protein